MTSTLIKKINKVLLLSILAVSFSIASRTSIYADSVTDAVFSINPTTGYIVPDQEFKIDVLINTKGQKALLSRAVLTYDPTIVKVTKAERNNTLFCSYPDNQQSIDNTNGVVMITGFCQSGVATQYATSGDPDVFARVTFKTLKAGQAKFDWEFTGQDLPFKTIIVKDGSPPVPIISAKPASVSFTSAAAASGGSTGGNTGSSGNTGSTGKPTGGSTPNTGIFSLKAIIAGGVLLSTGLLLYIGFTLGTKYFNKVRKYKTIVVYE